MKMYLISDNVDTLTGMRLAGVEGCVVHEKEELRHALDAALHNPENAVVLLTEKFGRDFPDVIGPARASCSMPLIIEIPDRHGTGRKATFITAYVNDAIGLHL